MKIGLLDQYTGENLGDAAILEATIYAIRQRLPDAELCLFCLYPDGAKKRHSLPCYSIVGWRIPWYSDFSYIKDNANNEAPDRTTSALSAMKEWVKSMPLLFSLAKRVHVTLFKAYHLTLGKAYHLTLGKLLGFAGNVYLESIHTVRSFFLLKGLDLLIISGGGQIDDNFGGPWGHPYSLMKWGLLARITGTRYVFLSVGSCSINSKLSAFFIKHALLLAEYRSYRDEKSRFVLETLFNFPKDDHVYPDLAFGFPIIAQLSAHEAPQRPLLVGISPILYLSRGWPQQDLDAYARYKSELATAMIELVRRGYNLCVFQSDDTDRIVVREIMALVKVISGEDLEHKIVQRDIPSLEALIEVISTTQVVIGSRLHGILLSHMSAKPVIAISYDQKVTTHMDYMGQSENCLDIHTFNSDEVLERFASIQERRQATETVIRERMSEFIGLLDKQYDEILHGQIST